MGVGSYLPAYNKVQIIRMNEYRGLTKEFEISEPWPPSKILWLPKPEDALPPQQDLLATSSDILRLYILKRNDNSGLYETEGGVVNLINRSDFCQPISSFDWN